MSTKEQTNQIKFAAQEKSVIKRTLLCRTGKFDGMYGEVEVTQEMLNRIADKYKSDKENPTNENDYAPILLDHNRSVDLVQGRILAEGMEVSEWKEIDGEMSYGLFGNLRIDSPQAQEHVASGKYAQVSISFDEESGELFEVSFVAVEAARGSMVLSQSQGGKKMATNNKFAALAQKHTALKARVGENRKARKTALSKLIKKAKELESEITALKAKNEKISLSIKTGQIKAKFNSFVKCGKINPVALAAMDFSTLATLNEQSLGMVLSAYENLPVSSDVHTFGQKSNKQVQADLSPAKMREAMALQKSGKKTALAEGDKEEEKEEKEMSEGEENKEGEEKPAMSADDMKQCLDEMNDHHAKLGEAMNKMKDLAESMKSLADDEEKAEKKEMEGDEGEDMAAEDDKEEKEKNEGDK